jgi:hypothetical protein
MQTDSTARLLRPTKRPSAYGFHALPAAIKKSGEIIGDDETVPSVEFDRYFEVKLCHRQRGGFYDYLPFNVS